MNHCSVISRMENIIDDIDHNDVSDIVLDTLEDLKGFIEFESSVYCLFLPENELDDEVMYDMNKSHPFSTSVNFYSKNNLIELESHNLWKKIGQKPDTSLLYYGIYYHIKHTTSIDTNLLRNEFNEIRKRVSQLTERNCYYGYTNVLHEKFNTILMLYFKVD